MPKLKARECWGEECTVYEAHSPYADEVLKALARAAKKHPDNTVFTVDLTYVGEFYGILVARQ